MSSTLITSRDPKGRQFMSIVEAAYNKAKLDNDAAQLLNERGHELKAEISELIAKFSVTNEFADEEVESFRGYISGYTKPDTILEQAETLSRLFNEYQLGFPNTNVPKSKLPEGAEGWFAIPRWQLIAPTYGEAVERVIELLISKAYGLRFENLNEGRLGPKNLRQSTKSVGMWEKLEKEQKSDILVIPAQFGVRHRGRSVRRARAVMSKTEFGLGAFAVGVMLLTHPHRFQNKDDLFIDCAGDESQDPLYPDLSFEDAPCFVLLAGTRRFSTDWFGVDSAGSGSASAWISS